MYEVKYSYLGEEYKEIIDECITSLKDNLLEGNFILRDDVSILEKQVCKYLSSFVILSFFAMLNVCPFTVSSHYDAFVINIFSLKLTIRDIDF